MDEEEEKILREVWEHRDKCMRLFTGKQCCKYSGASTCHAIRNKLRNKGYNISERNVFIEGLHNEIDLLLLKQKVNSKKAVYKPNEVLAIFEIKFRGAIYKGTEFKADMEKIKDFSKNIKKLNKNIVCFYVAILERKSYPYTVTKKDTGFEIFKLFFHKENKLKNLKFKRKPTGHWNKLLNCLKKIRTKNDKSNNL